MPDNTASISITEKDSKNEGKGKGCEVKASIADLT